MSTQPIPAPGPPAIRGLKIISSGGPRLKPDTKLAMLLSAPSGMGKTSLAGSLDRLTQVHEGGRRTLYIPLEASELGGAATIRHLDIPMFIPESLSDLNKALGALRNDKTFAGIVLDPAQELVHRFVQPTALKYPPKENHASRTLVEVPGTGVPSRSDYQVIGELTAGIFNQLLQMTTHPDPALRKHLIVTATTKTEEDGDTGRVAWKGPNIPGRMGKEAAAMFQVCGTIRVKTTVVDKVRRTTRWLCTATDGIEALKDRFNLMPPEIQLCSTRAEGVEGEDLCSIWEKYWMPAMEAREVR